MPKILLLLFLPATLLAQAPDLDWKKLQAETLEHFSAMVRINSSNPPGNETVVAKYIQSVLQREGIPSKLVGTDPDRLSVIARLKGSGAKKPILIMGHTDVVGVQREKWSEDPFGAKLVDGYVWGRGTIDDKDLVAGALMTMLILKRCDFRSGIGRRGWWRRGRLASRGNSGSGPWWRRAWCANLRDPVHHSKQLAGYRRGVLSY
jgi:hypothetical protein